MCQLSKQRGSLTKGKSPIAKTSPSTSTGGATGDCSQLFGLGNLLLVYWAAFSSEIQIAASSRSQSRSHFILIFQLGSTQGLWKFLELSLNNIRHHHFRSGYLFYVHIFFIRSCCQAIGFKGWRVNKLKFFPWYNCQIVSIYDRVHSSVNPQQSHLAKSTSIDAHAVWRRSMIFKLWG